METFTRVNDKMGNGHATRQVCVIVVIKRLIYSKIKKDVPSINSQWKTEMGNTIFTNGCCQRTRVCPMRVQGINSYAINSLKRQSIARALDIFKIMNLEIHIDHLTRTNMYRVSRAICDNQIIDNRRACRSLMVLSEAVTVTSGAHIR